MKIKKKAAEKNHFRIQTFWDDKRGWEQWIWECERNITQQQRKPFACINFGCELSLLFLPQLLCCSAYIHMKRTHMFPSWFSIRKKERDTLYEQRQQFSIRAICYCAIEWNTQPLRLLACVYCNSATIYTHTRAHTSNEFASARQSGNDTSIMCTIQMLQFMFA